MSTAVPEPEPSSVAELIFRAWNSHDAHTFDSLFPADAEFTDVLGHHAVGPEAIARLHVMAFARLFAAAELTLHGVRTRRLTPGLASVHADWSMEGHGTPQGVPLPHREGAMHIITELRDGCWLPLELHNADYGAPHESLRDAASLRELRGQD